MISTLSDEKQSSNRSDQDPDLFNDGSVTEDEEITVQDKAPNFFSGGPAQEETTSEVSYKTQEEQDLEGNSVTTSIEENSLSDQLFATSNEESEEANVVSKPLSLRVGPIDKPYT